ncbi:MAG: hypothetical protein LC808_30910 [Actinobacteria bacterium]|nr:hypothetical protein [Actinomycetota bacterium]
MAADQGRVVHVQVQLGEDDLGEGVLHAGVASAVEGLRITEQFDGGEEELSSGVKLGGGVGQLPLDFCPFTGDSR